jgi:hypothetical protein
VFCDSDREEKSDGLGGDELEDTDDTEDDDSQRASNDIGKDEGKWGRSPPAASRVQRRNIISLLECL